LHTEPVKRASAQQFFEFNFDHALNYTPERYSSQPFNSFSLDSLAATLSFQNEFWKPLQEKTLDRENSSYHSFESAE
jgi:hypothetical protein